MVSVSTVVDKEALPVVFVGRKHERNAVVVRRRKEEVKVVAGRIRRPKVAVEMGFLGLGFRRGLYT